MVQLSLLLQQNSELMVIIDLLEKNLDLLGEYYDKPPLLRVFTPKPGDGGFKNKLAGLASTRDHLLKRFVQVLIQLEDGRNFSVQLDTVIPYGLELQKRIIDSVGEKH